MNLAVGFADIDPEQNNGWTIRRPNCKVAMEVMVESDHEKAVCLRVREYREIVRAIQPHLTHVQRVPADPTKPDCRSRR